MGKGKSDINKSSVMKKLLLIIPLMILLLVAFLPEAAAQCPMCRMTAESNLANGGQEGQGLNNAILFLLATPYLLVGGMAYLWWKNKRKKAEKEESLLVE